MKRVTFQPNIPQTFRLVDPQGEYDFDLHVGRYQTSDGREIVLPRQAVIKLNELDPAAGEEIGICRYDKKHGKGDEWAIWLTSSSEKDRAISEIDQSELAQQLQASLDHVNGNRPAKEPVTPIRKPSRRAPDPEVQPRLFDRGTGTDGRMPQRVLIPAAAPTRRDTPEQIPWNVAFREVAKFVSSELAACNLQWSDEAQQAAVCTVLIAEVKKGRIGLWER